MLDSLSPEHTLELSGPGSIKNSKRGQQDQDRIPCQFPEASLSRRSLPEDIFVALNTLRVKMLVDPLHDKESTKYLLRVVVAQPDQHTLGMLVNLPRSGNLQILLFIIGLIYTERIRPKVSHASMMSELLKRCREIEGDRYNMISTVDFCSLSEVSPNIRDHLIRILQSSEGSDFEMASQNVLVVA
jgi:hypothetical protein